MYIALGGFTVQPHLARTYTGIGESDDSIILQVCDEIINILQNDARLDDVNDNDIKIGKEEDMRNVARVIGFPAILVIPGSDDIEPISVAKEQHTMTVYVMPIHKGYDDSVDIRSIINLGDGVYDALIEKQNLNGKAERVFITKDDPSYISRKNSVLYFELLKCEIWKVTMGAT
jgi:hypothetical protein